MGGRRCQSRSVKNGNENWLCIEKHRREYMSRPKLRELQLQKKKKKKTRHRVIVSTLFYRTQCSQLQRSKGPRKGKFVIQQHTV